MYIHIYIYIYVHYASTTSGCIDWIPAMFERVYTEDSLELEHMAMPPGHVHLSIALAIRSPAHNGNRQ